MPVPGWGRPGLRSIRRANADAPATQLAGRAKDKRAFKGEEPDDTDGVKLEYRVEFGRLQTRAEAFRQLDGMLKPGGWLAVMTTLQVDDAEFANWHYRRDPTHVVFYRQVTLQTIASRFGWDYEYAGHNVSLMFKP